MRRGLMRPAAALFPIVLLLAALFGNGEEVANLFFYYCVIQLFSLCSVDSFRNAAAREPGVKRVDRRFSGTWIPVIFGIAVCVFAEYLLEWNQNSTLLIIAAGCIIFEQLFEERMYALSHPSDGVILSVVSNGLLLAGLLIDSSSGVLAPMNASGFYTVCGAGLGMMISIITSYIIEPMHAFSLIPRNIGFFPKACVQTLLYPVLTLMVFPEPGVIVGFMLWRLSRTVCRRAQDESRLLNLLLVTVAGAAIVASVYGLNIDYPIAIFIALVCAAIVFCAPGWRFYVAVALITAALGILITGMEMGIILDIAIIACAAIAVVLNLHKAFLRKV